MRIVVAGGTGFLGSRLVESLRGDNHAVTVLTRRPTQPNEVRWSPGNDGWTRALDGADVVVNLAGAGIADRRWTNARKRLILESRLESTRALVSAMRNLSRAPAAFISASGINFYASHESEIRTEASPPGSDFLANVCIEWEREALQAASMTRVVTVRSGMVLARSGGALPKLALPFHLFVGGKVGSGRQPVSWIHRDDWVSMVRWAMDERAVSGPLNVTSPNPVTNAEFARVLGRVLRRPALFPVPAFVLRLAVGEMADGMLLSGTRAVPAKAQSHGFTFAYAELESALREIYAM